MRGAIGLTIAIIAIVVLIGAGFIVYTSSAQVVRQGDRELNGISNAGAMRIETARGTTIVLRNTAAQKRYASSIPLLVGGKNASCVWGQFIVQAGEAAICTLPVPCTGLPVTINGTLEMMPCQ